MARGMSAALPRATNGHGNRVEVNAGVIQTGQPNTINVVTKTKQQERVKTCRNMPGQNGNTQSVMRSVARLIANDENF
jgi:hypothetical protein